MASTTSECTSTMLSDRTTPHGTRDNLALSPNKTRIGAARVDFLGRVISQDGVRPNDDKIAALAQIPMPRDIKQPRSLLGGLSYYRKFLSTMAKHVRSITSLLKKELRLTSLPRWKRPFAPYSRNSQPHRYLSFPIGTLLSTSLDHSACTAMPAPMVSEQHSSRTSLTDPSAPLSILAKQPSLMNVMRPLRNSKPDALYGVSTAFAATYLAFSP